MRHMRQPQRINCTPARRCNNDMQHAMALSGSPNYVCAAYRRRLMDAAVGVQSTQLRLRGSAQTTL